MRRREEKFPDNGFEAWGGYMQAKIAKLEDQFTIKAGGDEKLSDIFSGVSIYVNGFTIPSADELKTLMSKHGGVYHTYQRSEDYIIASNLPDTKVKNMSLARVVKPEWITNSIASNCLLDYKKYLLYKNSRTQQQLNFNKITKNIFQSENSVSVLPNKSCLEDSLHKKDKAEHLEVSPSNIDKIDIQIGDVNTSKRHLSGMMENNLKPLHTRDGIEQKPKTTKTAVDPNFISEFYNNSRLHHISQLGACFKQYVNDLRDNNSNFTFPACADLKKRILALNNLDSSPIFFEKGKVIMHIDMDCFFVSVGLRNRPHLRGKPVAVTHSKGGQPRLKRPGVDRSTEFNLYKQKLAKKMVKATGIPEEEIEVESRVDNITDEDDKYGSMSEIASCSYEARAKGISNGMFMGAALKLCPDLQTIPYDFEGYKEVAYTLYNTIAQYTLDIEAVSCDEMYVDCTQLLKELHISVQDFATVIREEIKSKTGCPCSTGFGGNRLQARLATKKAKPDGQFFLTADLVEDFMFDIKLRDLPGVGRQTAQKLESLGHTTCGSLQNLTLAALKCHLRNKTGTQVFDQCRGKDNNPLTFHSVRKSVSAEVNYGIRFENNDQCMEFLKQLSTEVHSRMQQLKVLGKCITLKLMVRAEEAPIETAKFMGHGFCNVINKSTSLNNATDDIEIITKEVILLCKKQNVDPKEMRGIGIQITKLESLNCKQITTGAINKYLTKNKLVLQEHKSEKLDEINSAHLHFCNNDPNQMTKNETEFSNKNQTTPKKSKVFSSPEKRSPILGSIKSPGKKRGRPSKIFKGRQSVVNNFMNRFLQGQSGRDTPYKDPMIKTEAIPKELKLKEESCIRSKGFLDLPWEKVRELLRAWLDSGQAPLQCDVDLIVGYMQEMVVNKNIEKIYILLNFLRRRTKETGCPQWVKVYDHVLEQVQNVMIVVYGKKMFLSD